MRALFACLFFLLSLTACEEKLPPLTEAQVWDEIMRSTYCNTAEDCVQFYPGCPFGCGLVVSKNDSERVREAIRAYAGPRCVYSCVALEYKITCSNHTCGATSVTPETR